MRTNRFNSPSAINTINQCRRKYFYKYKLGIQEDSSIEMLLGNLVHHAIKEKADNREKNILSIFDSLLRKNEDKIKIFRITKEELNKLYEDCRKMLLNWEKDFDPDASLECEVALRSEKYQVLGIVDEIIKKDGKVSILDNKTSAREGMNKNHETQLAVYALLYLENFGKLPDYVGIRFLRTGNKEFIPVNDRLISKAIYECRMMNMKNHPDNIIEYPRNPSPLCNWGRGKCSYLERCYP